MRAVGLPLLASAAVAFAPGLSTAATRIEPIHPERENVPPSIRRDLVLADLEQILSGPVSPTSIATAPYAASRNGLCRRDVITVRYERQSEGDRRAPLKPVGVYEVSTEYHRLDDGKPLVRADLVRACAKLSGQQTYWARSDSEHSAEFALASLSWAVAAVSRNEPISIRCEDLDQGVCASEFLRAAPQVSMAAECRDQTRDISNQCSTFRAGNYDITIMRRWPKVGNEPPSTNIQMKAAEIIVT